MAKYSQEDKEAYMKHYRKHGKNSQTFGQWMRSKKSKGSSQTKRGMSGLSSGDYAAISKMMGKKKGKK